MICPACGHPLERIAAAKCSVLGAPDRRVVIVECGGCDRLFERSGRRLVPLDDVTDEVAL